MIYNHRNILGLFPNKNFKSLRFYLKHRAKSKGCHIKWDDGSIKLCHYIINETLFIDTTIPFWSRILYTNLFPSSILYTILILVPVPTYGIQVAFEAYTKVKTGYGRNTRFLYDAWIGPSPLKIRYQDLYGLKNNGCFVS